VIQEGGCPIIRHNTITRQERCGIAILDGGSVQTLEVSSPASLPPSPTMYSHC
jgi:hypothetical protein